jgi:multisubunit Na+/H+ antiporter MnhB subunit
MIVGSVLAIETKNMLSSVIAVGAVGFGVSLMFLFLGAPDIAITQVIVEVLSLIILIRTTIFVDNRQIEKKTDSFATITGLLFLGFLIMAAIWAFEDMTPFGEPLMRVSRQYLSCSATETGAWNSVAGIILDYRGYDTLGEAMVIFVSILGAFAILRRRGKKTLGEQDTEKVGIIE